MTVNDELKGVFIEESYELIDRFGVLISSLLNTPAAERAPLLEELLRVTHNLKGAARTVGHTGMETLTHQIEEDLEPFKDDPSTLPEKMIAKIGKATSAMQILVEGMEHDLSECEAPESDAGVTGERDRVVQAGASRSSIRVDTERFDELMSFSGELLMSRARMEERYGRLKGVLETLKQHASRHGLNGESQVGEAIHELGDLIQSDIRDRLDFQHLTDRMNETMKKVRMVPLRRAEREWREVFRKAAHTTGKEVAIDIDTGTIELDKHVLDLLRDPMMHLIRNAVDHGVEAPEERAARKKPPVGRVEIGAAVQGAMVQIRVTDDGRGVRRRSILERAARLNLMPPNRLEQLSDEETLELLFHPGLSTAAEVSHLSGRGVGLDVVRAQVEALGGSVTVWSPENGVGTSFLLSVPLSVLSTIGLYVRSGQCTYALPLEYVEKTVRAKKGDMENLDGQMILKQAGGDPIRLASLRDLLGAPGRNSEAEQVVILSRSNILLGVLVDQVEGHHEFVTQSLPWNLARTPGTNGASIRADGSVVITLDVPYLFERAGSSAIQAARNSMASTPLTRKVLVVDDSLAARTLEKNILLDAGYQVILAEDGEEAWRTLERESFDLVVSDVDMPKLDGLELTRRIRKNNKLRDLPVILVTSLDKPEQRVAGGAAGADEYVVKGTFDQMALLEIVSKYL